MKSEFQLTAAQLDRMEARLFEAAARDPHHADLYTGLIFIYQQRRLLNSPSPHSRDATER